MILVIKIESADCRQNFKKNGCCQCCDCTQTLCAEMVHVCEKILVISMVDGLVEVMTEAPETCRLGFQKTDVLSGWCVQPNDAQVVCLAEKPFMWIGSDVATPTKGIGMKTCRGWNTVWLWWVFCIKSAPRERKGETVKVGAATCVVQWR